MHFKLVAFGLGLLVLSACGRPESPSAEPAMTPVVAPIPRPNATSAWPEGTSIGTSGGDINMERWLPLIRGLANEGEDELRIDDLG